jgi:hypothetical protein
VSDQPITLPTWAKRMIVTMMVVLSVSLVTLIVSLVVLAIVRIWAAL